MRICLFVEYPVPRRLRSSWYRAKKKKRGGEQWGVEDGKEEEEGVPSAYRSLRCAAVRFALVL
jgi:hypothetical protein